MIIRSGKMMKIQTFLVLIFAVSIGILSAKDLSESFQYISPLPGAKLVSKATNIIIRPGEILAENSIVLVSLARIEGSVSGIHDYEALISDDKKTIIFKPSSSFEPGEVVTVTLEKS